MSRWHNRKTTIKYAREILRQGASEKVLIDREALRTLTICAEKYGRTPSPTTVNNKGET